MQEPWEMGLGEHKNLMKQKGITKILMEQWVSGLNHLPAKEAKAE